MNEFLDDLQVMLEATNFFSFKRKKELESCISVCYGSYKIKRSRLTLNEKEEFYNYLTKKEAAANYPR